MNHKLLRPLISCLLIAALMAPAMAQAMPAAPADQSVWPAETPRDDTFANRSPLAGLASAPGASRSLEGSATPVTPVGRLLLSPAIDGDSNPLTNPTNSVPVQRVGGDDSSQDVLYAEISLAAEVLPADPQRNPAGALVTFRVWHESDPVELVRAARADAWGAAATSILFDDLHLAGRWFYQASAPGYGETPVRSFTFDTARYSQELRLGAARVAAAAEAGGRLAVTVTSDVPLDETSTVDILLVRLIPSASDPANPEREILPTLPARRVDERTAVAGIFLEEGDYLAAALVRAGNVSAQSAPALVHTLAVTTPPVASVVASYEKRDESGLGLVHYLTPQGDAALLHRSLDDLPPGEQPRQTVFEDVQRIGAFQWQVDTYDLAVEVVADDGKKRVRLDGFTWDPIARRYDIVIDSLMDEPVEDKLTVQVFGPGNIMIYEETVPIWLDPEQPLLHSVSVPAELGEPQSLRIVVHDPAIVDWLVEKGQALISAIFNTLAGDRNPESGFSLTVSHKVNLTVANISLLQVQLSCAIGGGCTFPPVGGIIGDWLAGSPTDWQDVLSTGLRDFMRAAGFSSLEAALAAVENGIEVGSFDWLWTIGESYAVNLYACAKLDAEEQARNLAEKTGRNLEDVAANLNQRFSTILSKLAAEGPEPVPFAPPISFLSYRISPVVKPEFTGGRRGEYSVYADLQMQFGWNASVIAKLPSYWAYVRAMKFWGKLLFKLWDITEQFVEVNTWMNLISEALKYREVIKKKCKPSNPNGNPDDRRDAGANDFVPTPAGATGDVQYLQGQLATAQQLGLTRAATYWTLHLRRAEIHQLISDMTLTVEEVLERAAIYEEAVAHMDGLISGSILPPPGQTITDAVASTYEAFVVNVSNTGRTEELRELQDALEFAQRQYNLLRGQELALQQELRAQLGQAGFGVLDSGLVTWALTALGSLGVQAAPVQIVAGTSTSGLRDSRYFTPFEAPSVLLVPSGGFNRYAASQEARDWLDTYVNLGGTLLVLAQADSADWDLLPGGGVEGLGYDQDILCKTASVHIVNSSPWIKGIGRDLPDIQIDGSFTAWPAEATVVLVRTTGNQLPAMIEYDYGAGHVVAMSAYPDFYINGMQSVEDIVFARSLFGLAYLQATGEALAATASAPGAPVSLPLPVTNHMAQDAAELTVMHDYYESHVGQAWRWAVHRPRPLQSATAVDLAPDLASGDARTVDVAFTAPPRAGIFRTGYFLGTAGATAYVPAAWYRSGGIQGPFYEVQTTYTPPPGFSLRASRERFAFGETAAITATVLNNLPAPRTLTLSPTLGLEDGPVTLNVPALGTAQHVYTTRVYQRQEVRVQLSEGGIPLSTLPLVLRLSPPFLGLGTSTDQVPAGLATSVTVTATLVDDRASQVDWEARLAGALVDSETTALAPSGPYSVTVATLSLPAAAPGDELTVNAALVSAAGAMTRTLAVVPPMTVAGLSLPGPLLIDAANAGAVRVKIDDAGIAGSGQLQAVLRRAGDPAPVASGPLQAVALGGGRQEVSLDLPLPATLDPTNTFSVVVQGSGQVSGGASVAVSRTLALPPIALDAILIDAVRAVRDPMPVRVYATNGLPGILPSGVFSVTVSSPSPAWSGVQSPPVTLEIASLILDSVTPELPRGGQYEVTVETAQLPGWSAVDTLDMPDHALRFSTAPNLTAGDVLSWTVSNEAGVDTTIAGALSLLDDAGVSVVRQSVAEAVPVHDSATVTMTVPVQLRSGDYRLRWSGVDHLDNLTGDEQSVALTGLDVALDSQTDQPYYLSHETVTALGVITPSAPLEGAQLRLRVASRGGNPYVAEYGEPGVVVTTVAGGAVDAAAVGKALRFDEPGGLTFSPAGDHVLLGSGRAILQVDTATWQGRVVAGRSGMGNSAVDNYGLLARFAANLMSVSYSGDGAFALLVEFGRGVIRRYDTATGRVSFVAGGGGGCADGVGAAARFNFPGQSAVSHDGSFALVTDTCGLRRIDMASGAVSTLAAGLTGGVAIAPGDAYALVAYPTAHTVNLVTLPGGANSVLAGTAFTSGSADGVGAAARFNGPGGIAISADGSFALVNDTGNHTVRRISMPGAAVTTLAGAVGQAGFADESGSAARFDTLRTVGISPDGSYALLEDRDNDAVRRLDLATNAVTTVVGNWRGADGLANEARFQDPWDIAVSEDGAFALIADYSSATIRRMDLATGLVTTIAGAFEQHATVDGVGTAARFNWPAGVAISPDGATALVVDDTHAVVRRIDLHTLQVTTVAGSPGQSGYVDAIGSAARFDYPEDVVFSPDGGYALIADWDNNAVRKLDLATAEVTTFVAPGAGGMDDVRAVDISSDGSFALVGGVADCALFRVDITGGAASGVTQIAGNSTCDPVDGVGLDASFDDLDGIAISPDGSVALVSERFPKVIRLVDLATLEVTTVAGAAWEDTTMRDGPGAAARVYQPIGVDFGPDGTWALTTVQLGHAVARLDLTTLAKAQVQTVVNRSPASDGFGPEARLYNPSAIAVSAYGNFAVVADSGNNAVRVLTLGGEREALSAAVAAAANAGDGLAAAADNARPLPGAAGPARSQPAHPTDRSSRSAPLRSASSSSAVPDPLWSPTLDLPPATLATLAGQSGSWGDDDGIGSAARFNWPEGIALSPDDSFALVSDTWNYTIRRIDLATAEVTTLAGSPGQSGSTDGVGSTARFNVATGIAVSPDGSYALVADTWNHTVRRIDLASAAVTTVAGLAGSSGSADGAGSTARFNNPRGLAISSDGSFALVADESNGTMRRIDLLTNTVTTLAGQPGVWGSDDGVGSGATFGSPSGVSLSADGSSAVVIDSGTFLMRHIDLATGMVTTLAGQPEMFGYYDGVGSAARFGLSLGVALSPDGVWALVADFDGSSVRYVDVASREVATLVSLPLHQDGAGADVRLNWPNAIDLSADGSTALIVDSSSNTVRRLDAASGQVTTVAGEANDGPGSADAVGATARFRWPGAGALDAAGTVAYIADTSNYTIRRVDMLNGAVTTIAGSPGVSGSADGVGSAARFYGPRGLALSPDESYLLVADTLNHTIRRLDLLTYAVTTVAGSPGASGYADGVGSAARLDWPHGVAISPDGSYALIADTFNQLVRRLDLNSGVMTRLAGWPDWESSLDGFLDSAYFSYPRGVAISADGSYALVADSSSGLVRRIGLTGPDAQVVTTVAGEPWSYGGADGVGSAARFYWAYAVATSDDPTFALALDAEGGTVRRLGLPGQGIVPATVLRQEWQPVDGLLDGPAALGFVEPFIDPNLLEDGRARGQLFLEVDLFSNAPAGATLPGQRHRLASASYPFLVDDASDGLAFASQRQSTRRNVPGYSPDDAASAVQFSGLVRNTGPAAATIELTITRDGATTVATQTFAAVDPGETRFFTASDPTPPAGTRVYEAVTDIGSSAVETVTVRTPVVAAVVSAAPSEIALGEATTLRLALTNEDDLPAYVGADLGEGVQHVALESGEALTVTRVLTPAAAGALNVPVTLSGDLGGVQAAALTVRDESATAALALAGLVRSGAAPVYPAAAHAGLLSDPQLVRTPDAGLTLSLASAQSFSFDVLVDYTISGPATVAGSALHTVTPGVSELTVSLATAPAGAYTAAFDVRHARLGTLIASESLAFELVEPAYDLSLDATTTGLDGSEARQIDVTAGSGAASEGAWNGFLRLSGALLDEQALTLAPGGSSVFSTILALDDRAGQQSVLVELVAPDGSTAASALLPVQAEPRAAPAATLDGVTVDPSVAGGNVTIAATVGNDGPAGEAVLEVTAFDQTVEVVGEVGGGSGLRGPAAASVFTATVPVPPDLLAGSYPVVVRLGSQALRAEAVVTGAEIDLRQWLNAEVYQPDSLATWTVELEGLAGAAAQYDVELRYGDQSHVQTVTVGAGQTVQVPWIVDVGPVSDRGTVLVQTHPLSPEQTRHSLIIDSQWIPVQEDVRAWLETDQSRYNAGDLVHLAYHLETPMQSAMVLEPDGLLGEPGPLVWSSLQVSPTEALTYTVTITDPVSGNPVNQTVVLTETNWLQGDFPFSYELPAVMATGRYFFRYFFGGEERTQPIDVFGVDLKVTGFVVSGPGVDAGRAAQAGGPVSAAAKLHLNVPLASARLSLFGLGPDGEYLDLGPTAVMTMPLPAGDTAIALNGVLAPQQPGPHQLVFKVIDAASLVELGGEAAIFDVGRAGVSSLLTDQGTYLPGEAGTGELTVYGYGPATLVVTDTVGGTLLSTTATLNGFATYNFPIYTATAGDYLLVARTADAAGMVDSALRAYAVPLPADTEPPVLTLTNPSTHTILYSAAPTVTLTVQGVVSDNRGPVTVYVDGRPASEIVDSGWSAPVMLSQGNNAVSAVALDDAGNFTTAPLVNVILTPQGAVSHAPDRASALVGEQLTFESTLQASGTISNAQLIQFLPPGQAANVTAGASSGQVMGIADGPEGVFVHWQGDVGSAPVTIAMTVTLSSAGILTSTATAFWGWGLNDQAEAPPVQVNSPLGVVLNDFSAFCEAGTPLVAWETLFEINHRGFNLYRGPTPAGWDTQINSALIPAQNPGGGAGAWYQWHDLTAPAGQEHYYWLEDIAFSGVATMHGPISVLCLTPTAVRLGGLQASPATVPAAWWHIALALATVLGGLGAMQRKRR